jgi:hypothetical protein
MMSQIFRLPSAGGRRLNLLGAAVLIVGLSTAAWIWMAQDRVDQVKAGEQGDATESLATLDSRKQVRDIELNYGQAGVVYEEGLEWVESLGHGKRLAATVAVGASSLASGCFLAAAYLLPRLERAGRPFEINGSHEG